MSLYATRRISELKALAIGTPLVVDTSLPRLRVNRYIGSDVIDFLAEWWAKASNPSYVMLPSTWATKLVLTREHGAVRLCMSDEVPRRLEKGSLFHGREKVGFPFYPSRPY